MPTDIKILPIQTVTITYFCIEYSGAEIRIPIQDLRDFQKLLNEQIEQVMDNYEYWKKDGE